MGGIVLRECDRTKAFLRSGEWRVGKAERVNFNRRTKGCKGRMGRIGRIGRRGAAKIAADGSNIDRWQGRESLHNPGFGVELVR